MTAEVTRALERLQRLHPKRIDLSLDRMLRLLAALGNPQDRLPPIVHVGGTNGKGSTVAFLRACLEAGGYRVHAYTSPHLVHFNERIRLGGAQGSALIGDALLVDVLDRCEQANDGAAITYFEVTTAAAFMAFAEQPADILLLEVGLGGRLDATNVIARPEATAITRISMDHMQFLGDTVTSIAREKAGIMKPGVPAVIGPQAETAALSTLLSIGADIGAELLVHGREWSYEITEDGFVIFAPSGILNMPAPLLPGSHQIANAATALMCLKQMPAFPLMPHALFHGLRTVDWPARLQRLTRGPLADIAPQGWELWLDGGHNDSAGEALANWLALQEPRPTYLIVGMLNSKTPESFLAPLADHVREGWAIDIPGEPASMEAQTVVKHAREAGIAIFTAAESPAAALAELAQQRHGSPARVLICGSLYLAGHILHGNG